MSRPKRVSAGVETIQVPEATADMVERRVAGINRRACFDQNIIRSIALSCYLQGLVDGVQVAAECPETVELFRG